MKIINDSPNELIITSNRMMNAPNILYLALDDTIHLAPYITFSMN